MRNPAIARLWMERFLDEHEALGPELEALATARAEELLQAHLRVRKAAGIRAGEVRVEVVRPVDLLGVYLFVPEGNA